MGDETEIGDTFELDDAATALAEACEFLAREDADWSGMTDHECRIHGALAFAQQLQMVMSDIAAEFGDDPVNAAATTVFALAGMVSDIHAIAYAAELYDGEIPPHPHRSQHLRLPQSPNRQQRRQMQREVERMRRRSNSGLIVPTTRPTWHD